MKSAANKLLALCVLAWACSFFSTSTYADTTCALYSNICTEPAETRTIGGIEFYRDCWNYEKVYYCETGEFVDTCSGLDDFCTVSSETCSTTNLLTGDCAKVERTYTCGDVQEGSEAEYLGSTYTVVKDEIDYSACSSYEENSTCYQTGNVCTEGPETRLVDGAEVYKDCWAWEYQYLCIGDTYNNLCEPLENICTLQDSTCDSTLPSGECGIETRTYDCATEQTEKDGVIKVGEQLTIVKDEIDSSECDDNRVECALEEKICTEGPETRNINGLDVYKDCWAWQETYTCLSDEIYSTCGDIDMDVCVPKTTECAVMGKNGECSSIINTYDCTYSTEDKEVLTCGDQVFCMGDDCYDTSYEPSPDFGTAAAYLGAVTAAGSDVDSVDDIDIFTGHKSTCLQYPLNTVDCCSDSGWANGSLTGCSNEDKMLIEERANKLTHYVGTYCSKEIPLIGTCIEYKQSYCTYEGMLARIIQEGARAQLGMSWGSAENPSCGDLSPEDLQNVRLDEIDFQEYIDAQEVQLMDNAELADKVADKIKDLTE